jgi:phage gp45-like
MLEELKAKIRNMIKQGVISLLFDDSEPYPIAQVTVNGKPSKYTRLSPYGLVSNPPLGSQVLLFSSQGQEANKFGIANGTINRRKGLGEGVCGLYNEKTGALVLMKEDGSVSVSGLTQLDVDSDLNVSGNITATGNISAEGDVIADSAGSPISLKDHQHLGNLSYNTGPALTTGGGVSPPSTPPTFDQSDNTIDMKNQDIKNVLGISTTVGAHTHPVTTAPGTTGQPN